MASPGTHAYEAGQERKAQELRWAFQWKEENCSLSSCPETLEEAEHNVEVAIRREGRATFARMMSEGAEVRAREQARRRQSIEEAQRSAAREEGGSG